MDDKNGRKKKTIAKFGKIKTRKGTPFLDSGGGIFTPDIRKKLLGIKKQPKPGYTKNQFWEDRRDRVDRAFIDLRLFLEVAGRDNVNRVVTRDSLTPVVEALLWRPVVDQAVPDSNLAEIAQMLIEVGFSYLHSIYRDSEHNIPPSIQRTIADAIEDSKYLVYQVEALRKAAIERRQYIADLKTEFSSEKLKKSVKP